MINKIFECDPCKEKFSYNEAWASKYTCAIYHNAPYQNWDTIKISCPYCGEVIVEEIYKGIIR